MGRLMLLVGYVRKSMIPFVACIPIKLSANVQLALCEAQITQEACFRLNSRIYDQASCGGGAPPIRSMTFTGNAQEQRDRLGAIPSHAISLSFDQAGGSMVAL